MKVDINAQNNPRESISHGWSFHMSKHYTLGSQFNDHWGATSRAPSTVGHADLTH